MECKSTIFWNLKLIELNENSGGIYSEAPWHIRLKRPSPKIKRQEGSGTGIVELQDCIIPSSGLEELITV